MQDVFPLILTNGLRAGTGAHMRVQKRGVAANVAMSDLEAFGVSYEANIFDPPVQRRRRLLTTLLSMCP